MERNVWRMCKSPWLYYITHPWKWIQDFILSIKWTYQRATKGYADVDWFGLFDWMIVVFSNMFDEFAEKHYGYPGEHAGFTGEKWTKYLREIAEHMRNASEDQEVQKNEFEELWSKISDDRWSKVKQWSDENGHIHREWPSLDEDQNAIREKYFSREKEIYDWRLNEARTALSMIGERFFDMWD